MRLEELRGDKLSVKYWDYLISNLVSNSLVEIAKDGKNLHEQIELILFYCKNKHSAPLNKIIDIESLVEKITGDLVSFVRGIYSIEEIKLYEEHMKKVVDAIRGSSLQFSKSRYNIDTVPVIIRPIISFLRVFILSPLDETVRKTVEAQNTLFASEVYTRCGLEPDKEDDDKKVKNEI